MKYIVEGSGADIGSVGMWVWSEYTRFPGFQIQGLAIRVSRIVPPQNWNNFTSPPEKKKLQKITKITKKITKSVEIFRDFLNHSLVFVYIWGLLFTSEN